MDEIMKELEVSLEVTDNIRIANRTMLPLLNNGYKMGQKSIFILGTIFLLYWA